MLKPDKDKIIPWLAVIFAGLLFGVLGRHIALRQSGDTGTANLTFVIVLGGVVFLFGLFLTLWESVHQLIVSKRRPKELSEEDDGEGGDEPEALGVHDDLYPKYDGGYDDESGDDDSGEEEVPPEFAPRPVPTPTPAPTPKRPDWVEVREREFQEKLALFQEYVHFAMEPHVSAEELARFDEYVELFAREMPLPKDIVPIRPTRLKNPDLYHFGWNMQNYFGVGKREEVVPWLQRVFTPLRDLEFSTIKGKLHDPQTRRHTIPNIDNIPKFMAEKRS